MFLIKYETFSVYFSGVMVCFMLGLAFVASMFSGVGTFESFKFFLKYVL